MGKLNARTGETLVEMLLSMLIISAALLLLAGAASTVARISRETRKLLRGDSSTLMEWEDFDFSNACYVQLENLNDHSSVKIPITVTEQHNGDFYYERGK